MKKLMFIAVFIFVGNTYAASPERVIETKDGRIRCSVRTYFGYNTTRPKCRWWDEVMIGITSVDPLTIRCARLEVTCNEREEDKKNAISNFEDK